MATVDPYSDHPLITIIESRIRAFAGEIDRATARILLDHFQHARDLSPEEFSAVLRRFPVESTPIPSGVQGRAIGSRFRTRSIGGRQ